VSLRISHLLPSVLSSLVGFSLKRNTYSSIRRDLAIRRITPRPQGKKVNSWLTLHARSPRRVNFRQREGAENLPFPGNSCTGTGRPHAFRHNERDNDVTEPSATRPEGVQLRARRSPRLIALGVLLIVLGALGAAAPLGKDKWEAAVKRIYEILKPYGFGPPKEEPSHGQAVSYYNPNTGAEIRLGYNNSTSVDVGSGCAKGTQLFENWPEGAEVVPQRLRGSGRALYTMDHEIWPDQAPDPNTPPAPPPLPQQQTKPYTPPSHKNTRK